jgi:hypothetical protein
MSGTRFSLPAVWLGLIALFYAGLLLAYAGYTTMYDGGVYYMNVMRLLNDPFQWQNLHMEFHPSVPYTLLLAASQLMDRGNMPLLYLTNFALCLGGFAAMQALLRNVFRGAISNAEAALGASIFAVTPVLMAHVFHLNLDLPLGVFFVMFLWSLHAERRWAVMVFGVLFLFTKETAAVLYAATVLLHLLVYRWRPSGNVRSAARMTLRQWHLFVPGLLFGAYNLVYRLSNAGLYWNQAFEHKNNNYIGAITDFDLNDPGMRAYLVNIFVLNFHWVLSVFIVAWLLKNLTDWMFGKHAAHSRHVRRADTLFFVLLLLAAAYIITRIRPWNNPRYAIAAYPLLVIVAQQALVSLNVRQRFRVGALGVTLMLVLLSNFRTFDPVSMGFYGTRDFGGKPWLFMTSKIDNPAYLRDMQFYNLEILEVDLLTDKALADIRPPPNAVILNGPWANIWFPNRIDIVTKTNTWRPTNYYPVRWEDHLEAMSPEALKPLLGAQSVFWFFALPNLMNDEYLAYLKKTYRLQGVKEYRNHGYTMSVYAFSL